MAIILITCMVWVVLGLDAIEGLYFNIFVCGFISLKDHSPEKSHILKVSPVSIGELSVRCAIIGDAVVNILP